MVNKNDYIIATHTESDSTAHIKHNYIKKIKSRHTYMRH